LARAELDIVRYSSNYIRNNRRYNKISSLPFSTAVTTSQIDWSQLLKSNNLLLSANQVERLLAILSATTIEIDCLFNNTVAMKTLDDLHSVLLQSQAGRIEAVRTTLMGEVEASAAVVQPKDLTAIANLLYQISVLDNENASELNERMRRHAFVLWTLLAMQGERNALYSLAQLMQAADGRQDLAEDLYRRAALQKHPHAMVPLHLALGS
jgi:hypothetical protein